MMEIDKMRYLRVLFFGWLAAVLFPAQSAVSADEVRIRGLSVIPTAIQSPDQRLEALFSIVDGRPFYELKRDGQVILQPSLLGLTIQGAEEVRLSESATLLSHSNHQADQTWSPVWGKRSLVRNHYNEAVLELRHSGSGIRFFVDIRLYDDGLAIRYRIPEQESLRAGTVTDEATEFSFAPKIVGYGVAKIERAPQRVEGFSGVNGMNTPLWLTAGNDLFVAIHEAGLLDFAPIRLSASTRPQAGNAVKIDLNGTAEFAAPLTTPWRVLFVGSRPGELMESDLLLNLAPPCRIADTGWIRPGKAMWDRRIRKLKHDGLEYWFNTETFIRLIDFASRSNIAHLLVDSNWYGNQRSAESNPMTPADGIDIRKVIDYGKKKGVGVFLYINDTAFVNHDMDEVFSTYRQWGAAGIKYGFMKGKGQSKVRKTVEVIEAAARHQLMVDFHDNPIHPSGISRTYPNLVTVEYCHAQLDAIRSFRPTDFINTVMVHMLAGPLDMNNGFYALNTLQDRTTAGLDYNKNYPVVSSTVAAENARILITDSGMMVISDAPWEYESKPDLFDFIRRLPNGAWDETRVLYAELNKGVTTARRFKDEWFVGSVINEHGGTRDIQMDFLNPGTVYDMTLYEDAPDSHFENNKEAYRVREMKVTSTDTVSVTMAPGGGCSMVIRPVK